MSSLLWMKTALALTLLFALTGVSPADSVSRPLSAQIDGPTSIDANGHGSVQVRVHLADDAAVPLPSATNVRAVILSGDARLSAGLSADLTTDATGSVSFPVYPGTQAGPLVIRFDTGDASVEVTYVLTADIRAPLVVGYATGGIGPVPGWVEAPDNSPGGNNARRGAISVFGTGKVANKTRGTFAYDSTNALEQTLAADPFLDNPNDRPFPIYGDGSIRHDDALSTNHFFGDVQNGASSQCGDSSMHRLRRQRPSAATTCSSMARRCLPAAAPSASVRSRHATIRLTHVPCFHRPVSRSRARRCTRTS